MPLHSQPLSPSRVVSCSYIPGGLRKHGMAVNHLQNTVHRIHPTLEKQENLQFILLISSLNVGIFFDQLVKSRFGADTLNAVRRVMAFVQIIYK